MFTASGELLDGLEDGCRRPVGGPAAKCRRVILETAVERAAYDVRHAVSCERIVV